MFLGYFTEEAYDLLLSSINQNAGKYSNEDEWLDDFFGNHQTYFKTSKSIDVGIFTPHYSTDAITDAQKSEEDLINARNIHEAYRTLTPLQASNKYMWTYLCHAVPKNVEYIRNRWMGDMRENTIKTRFFVTNSGSLLNDNALSRLWWYGHLTYDKTQSDPYALTKILLMNQTICTDVMDTMNRMNPNRIKGVLLAIKDFKDEIGDEGITDYFRECKKYLNHYAAVSVMDLLGPEEIRKLAFDYMMRIRQEKNSR